MLSLLPQAFLVLSDPPQVSPFNREEPREVERELGPEPEGLVGAWQVVVLRGMVRCAVSVEGVPLSTPSGVTPAHSPHMCFQHQIRSGCKPLNATSVEVLKPVTIH